MIQIENNKSYFKALEGYSSHDSPVSAVSVYDSVDSNYPLSGMDEKDYTSTTFARFNMNSGSNYLYFSAFDGNHEGIDGDGYEIKRISSVSCKFKLDISSTIFSNLTSGYCQLYTYDNSNETLTPISSQTALLSGENIYEITSNTSVTVAKATGNYNDDYRILIGIYFNFSNTGNYVDVYGGRKTVNYIVDINYYEITAVSHVDGVTVSPGYQYTLFGPEDEEETNHIHITIYNPNHKLYHIIDNGKYINSIQINAVLDYYFTYYGMSSVAGTSFNGQLISFSGNKGQQNGIYEDHNIYIEPDLLYYKNDNSWLTVKSTYRKINGKWVLNNNINTVINQSKCLTNSGILYDNVPKIVDILNNLSFKEIVSGYTSGVLTNRSGYLTLNIKDDTYENNDVYLLIVNPYYDELCFIHIPQQTGSSPTYSVLYDSYSGTYSITNTSSLTYNSGDYDYYTYQYYIARKNVVPMYAVCLMFTKSSFCEYSTQELNTLISSITTSDYFGICSNYACGGTQYIYSSNDTPTEWNNKIYESGYVLTISQDSNLSNVVLIGGSVESLFGLSYIDNTNHIIYSGMGNKCDSLYLSISEDRATWRNMSLLTYQDWSGSSDYAYFYSLDGIHSTNLRDGINGYPSGLFIIMLK